MIFSEKKEEEEEDEEEEEEKEKKQKQQLCERSHFVFSVCYAGGSHSAGSYMS